MITISEAAKKYNLTWRQMSHWASKEWIVTSRNKLPGGHPGNGYARLIDWREEKVLAAMAALVACGMQAEVAAATARGCSARIRSLEAALDKCKYNRATSVPETSGG